MNHVKFGADQTGNVLTPLQNPVGKVAFSWSSGNRSTATIIFVNPLLLVGLNAYIGVGHMRKSCISVPPNKMFFAVVPLSAGFIIKS